MRCEGCKLRESCDVYARWRAAKDDTFMLWIEQCEKYKVDVKKKVKKKVKSMARKFVGVGK